MTRILPLAALLTLTLAACAPALEQREPSWADRTFAPGQKWVVEAYNGDRVDTVTLVLGPLKDNGIGRAHRSTVGREEAVLNYGPYNPYDQSSESIDVSWKSSSFGGWDRMCVVRNPSQSPDPRLFQGRYAWSNARALDYIKTGNTEGTSTCTLRRVE